MAEGLRISSDIEIANDRPFVLFAGLNVIESRELAFEVARRMVAVTGRLGIPFVFKASFDKANRSSLGSFRGPGMDDGLRILGDIKAELGVPIITDCHEPDQAGPVAAVADVLQIPAFLARQTDLVQAAARTGAILNIKKPQFLAPHEMQHIIGKCVDAGNRQVMLCERGTAFGYNNLVVDMLGMDDLKGFDVPVIFDVTHALQRPGGRADSADGRRHQVTALARAGMALGLAGLFLEAHPDPDAALCDGPSALPLDQLEAFLTQIKALDDLVKGFDPVVTA